MLPSFLLRRSWWSSSVFLLLSHSALLLIISFLQTPLQASAWVNSNVIATRPRSHLLQDDAVVTQQSRRAAAATLAEIDGDGNTSSTTTTELYEDNSRPPIIPTGLESWQEDELLQVFEDVLFRMAYVMESNVLLEHENPALRKVFQTCVDSVEIHPSTIPGAGRGLFATRDIPKGTIVSFYPVHSIGCKFQLGSCLSLQIAESPDDMIDDVETSSYALYSLLERPLLGVDLTAQYAPTQPRLFVHMNPKATLYEGWYCGLINDAAIVRYFGDTEYYVKSRSNSIQNVEIVPFSRAAPFQVAVTTRKVRQGEEFFVSYGYNYWANQLRMRMKQPQQPQQGDVEEQLEATVPGWKQTEIEQQETRAALDILEVLEMVHQERYSEAAEGLAELFEGLGELPTFASSPATSTSSGPSTTTIQQGRTTSRSTNKDIVRYLFQRLLRRTMQTRWIARFFRSTAPAAGRDRRRRRRGDHGAL